MNEWDVDAAWYERGASLAAAGGDHRHANKLAAHVVEVGSKFPFCF